MTLSFKPCALDEMILAQKLPLGVQEELLKAFFSRALETLRDLEDTVRKIWQLKQILLTEIWSTGMHVSNL